jgi:hypothetical protein
VTGYWRDRCTSQVSRSAVVAGDQPITETGSAAQRREWCREIVPNRGIERILRLEPFDWIADVVVGLVLHIEAVVGRGANDEEEDTQEPDLHRASLRSTEQQVRRADSVRAREPCVNTEPRTKHTHDQYFVPSRTDVLS